MLLDWDDKQHINQLTKPLSIDIANALRIIYIDIWRQHFEDEPVEHKKSNAGRYAANVWLRETIDEMKYNKPDFLIEYENAIKQAPPRCCHSCDHYRYNDGKCLKFNQYPPEEFTQQRDQCVAWVFRIPF